MGRRHLWHALKKPDTNNWEKLIEGLADLNAWIRLMYIFPSRVTDRLIDAMAFVIFSPPKTLSNFKCCIIDMPIFFSTREFYFMLNRMNRRHDKAFLGKTIIKKMKAAIPNLAIRTTFICGFQSPEKPMNMSLKSVNFWMNFKLIILGVLRISPERETRANKMDGQVPLEIAQQRLDQIMTHHYKQRGERQLKRLGETIQVLYEGKQQCRSVYEAPDVDNLIILNQVPLHPINQRCFNR